MKYSELNLDPRLLAATEKLNYVDATPIQEQAIPVILENRDVAGLAQTGTGKTAAFVVPLVERILKTQTDPQHERAFKNWHARSFILILVPTRELAEQINENVMKITETSGLKSYPLYGGTGYEKQKEALQSGLQFIVSTPGRLIDLYKENHVDLKQVAAIVFDEADRMFDMGFKDDMIYILGRIPRERQFLVFSATLNFDVLNTAYQFGADPVEINISRDQAKAENVKDAIIHLGHEEKPQILLSLLKKQNPKQTIVFTNYKHNVDRVANFLIDNGMPAMGLSSLMNQSQRNKVIEKFKEDNDQNILVATDVAARGLDITGVDLVVNYEMPQDAESYVHRIGRTGRAGNEGKAFSLICDRDIDSLGRVEEYTKKKIEADFMEDADLVKDFKPLAREDGYKKKFDSPRREGGGPNRSRGDRPDRGGDRNRPPRRDKPEDKGGYVPGGKPKLLNDGQPVQGGKPQRPPRPQQEGGAQAQGGRPQNGKGPKHPRGPKPNGAQPQAAAQQGGYKPRTEGGNRPARNFRSNANNSNGNYKAPSKPAANASLGQKVKSFIQKIFG